MPIWSGTVEPRREEPRVSGGLMQRREGAVLGQPPDEGMPPLGEDGGAAAVGHAEAVPGQQLVADARGGTGYLRSGNQLAHEAGLAVEGVDVDREEVGWGQASPVADQVADPVGAERGVRTRRRGRHRCGGRWRSP